MANERLIFNNLDDIGDYTFDNDIDSTIKEYVNEAIDSIDGASANIFSSSEYVNLEKDLYKKNTYSIFEFDKLSVNTVDHRASSASLYKYFKDLEADSTYQLTTSEAISIDGLYFAIDGDNGIKEKTKLVRITNVDNEGKQFVIETPTDRITYFYGKFIPIFETKVKLKIKLENGYKPTQWTPSINDISNAIIEFNKANKENSETINDLKNSYHKFISTTLNDGIVKIAEAKAIESYINIVNGVVKSINASYETIKESQYIINTDEKRTLIIKHDGLIKAHNRLIGAIDDVINSNKITPIGKDYVNIAFDEFNLSVYDYQISYEKTKNLIDDKLREHNNELNKSLIYKLVISSTSGSVFKTKYGKSTLSATFFKNNKKITDDNAEFKWTRDSGNKDADLFWGKANNVVGKNILITSQDVRERATFTCETKVDGLIVSGSYEMVCLSIEDDIEEERGNMTFFSKPSKYKKGDRWVLTGDMSLLDNFYKKGQALEAVYATGNDSDWRLLIFADETDGVNLIRNYNFKKQTNLVDKTSKIVIPSWINTPKEAIVALEDDIPTKYYKTSINVIGDEYGTNYAITTENDEVIIFDE